MVFKKKKKKIYQCSRKRLLQIGIIEKNLNIKLINGILKIIGREKRRAEHPGTRSLWELSGSEGKGQENELLKNPRDCSYRRASVALLRHSLTLRPLRKEAREIKTPHLICWSLPLTKPPRSKKQEPHSM